MIHSWFLAFAEAKIWRERKKASKCWMLALMC